MDSWEIDDAYPRPALEPETPLVVNRSHLCAESGGFSVTVETDTFKWGDYVQLYWDGELVDKGYVGAVTYSLEFLVPVSVLERHPGRDHPGRMIEVFYVLEKYGATSLESMRRSPALVLDAKFTRPGGEDTDAQTPYINENLKPVEGTSGLAKGKDLVLTIPAWKNMEKGAQLTIYWGETNIEVDASAITVGQPVKVTVPWSVIDGAPQGLVSVTYAIRDRVGNTSGNAPAVEVTVVFAPLLPLPSLAYAINAKGNVDVDLAKKMASVTDSPDSTPLIVEYIDVESGDQIVVSLAGTTSTKLRIVPLQYVQVAAPALPLNDDPKAAVDPNQPPSARYVFNVPIAWLGYLAGGSIFFSYVVKRRGLDFNSATRTRSVVGSALTIPAPIVERAPEDGDVLDLNSFADDLSVSVEVSSIWPRRDLTASLKVRSPNSNQGFEQNASLLSTDDNGKLVWVLARERFVNFADGELSLLVVFSDSDGASVRSRERKLSFRPFVVAPEWPSLVISDLKADEQLALDDMTGDSLPVWVPLNGRFQPGDQVTLDWQGTAFGPYTVDKAEGSLAFGIPRSRVVASAGAVVTANYVVKRVGNVIGPQPSRPFRLRVAPVTIGILPSLLSAAASAGTLDVEKAKDGIVLTVPGNADVRQTDTIAFEVRAAGDTWRRVSPMEGHPKSGNVTTEDLIPSLGGSFAARYVVTRDGQSKTSDDLVLTLVAYDKNDPRLPRPRIKQLQQAATGEGNPYIDAKTLATSSLTVVVPPWPFMRAGQTVSVSILGIDSSKQFTTSIELATKRPVLESDLANGLSLNLPNSWVLGQPRVSSTDLKIVVVIERPLASESFKFMRLPVAVVNVVGLDKVEAGTGTGTEGQSDITISPPPRVIDIEGFGIDKPTGRMPLCYLNLYGDEAGSGAFGLLKTYAGLGEQYAAVTPAGKFNRYTYKRGRSGTLLLFDVKFAASRRYHVFVMLGPQVAGTITPTFKLHVEGYARPLDFQPYADGIVAVFQAPALIQKSVRVGLEVVPPLSGSLIDSTATLRMALGRYP